MDFRLSLRIKLLRLHASGGARNEQERVYMNAAEFGRYLAARQSEFQGFLTDMGLALKK